MQDKEKILIENWLLKAKEAFEDAESLIAQNRLNSAQNRLYYALFYLVMALAQSKNFATSKHMQLLGWFNREYVKTGIFSIESGRLYKTAYDNRIKSDYTITYKPKKEDLTGVLAKIKEFEEKIKEQIKIG